MVVGNSRLTELNLYSSVTPTLKPPKQIIAHLAELALDTFSLVIRTSFV